jgi:hypothetical protein
MHLLNFALTLKVLYHSFLRRTHYNYISILPILLYNVVEFLHS